jgi:hypothetical protein
VLREANRALHVSEIYRRMAEGGFEFRGQHPADLTGGLTEPQQAVSQGRSRNI